MGLADEHHAVMFVEHSADAGDQRVDAVERDDADQHRQAVAVVEQQASFVLAAVTKAGDTGKAV